VSDPTILETLKKASTAIYIVVEEPIAKEISSTMRRAITEIETLREQIRWAPVSERPEIEGEYLVMIQECHDSVSEMGICAYETDDFTDELGWIADGVTHWMPLPSPPPQESGE